MKEGNEERVAAIEAEVERRWRRLKAMHDHPELDWRPAWYASVEKRQLTPITKLYRVEAPLIAKAARAGQFVIVRVREGGERIPLTITDYDRESGLLTIVVQEVGATTRRAGSARRKARRSSTWSARWAKPPTSRPAATSSAWAAATVRRRCCA